LKFKLDENLDFRLSVAMREIGFDGDTVLDESLSGISDDGLFEVCKKTDRVLVTLDLDFANPFRFPPRSAPGIMVLRHQNPNLEQVRSLLFNALARLKEEGIEGRLWIVEPGRVRIYLAENDREEYRNSITTK
jgi:predicted nuclease of predicted toxin-antitoxin system